ncbi:hypothetical protein GGR50DRAFT_693817 [Xylaria sp. CBS 124048]|nr:hypothetical protein GGR50DRAFT_693817 [Xylaria sp. CBS 124048]
MKLTTAAQLASLATMASAAQDSRTFAVLRFNGDGFLTEGPVDPIVDPGKESSHYHGIMGGNKFSSTVEGDALLSSTCTTAKIANDKSNYWVPSVFFQDPKNGTFQKVPLFYMNVYYFFEPTDDEIQPFPVGLKMITGNSTTRSPPASGALQLDPNAGPINAVQWTCPRTSYNPPSYPVGSDGSVAGMVDPNNQGSGAGFPLYPCDGFASPLRQDMHFPSCYNPAVGLNDYENNMQFPANVGFKQNCPEGWIHTPHIFFEVYWNTPIFNDYWTPDGKSQPFVLSTGDPTGYSSHGDFIAGWDLNTLQTIISTCDAGDIGMDQCPQIPGGLNQNQDCHITTPDFGTILQNGQILTGLPVVGDNITGFGRGGVSGGSASHPVDVSGSSGSSDSGVAPTARGSVTAAAPSSSATAAAAAVVVAAGSSSSPAAAAAVVAAAGSSPAADSPAAAGTTPAPSAEAVPAAASGAGAGEGVVTVWDVVTVYVTTTVAVPAPTQAVRRDARGHGHSARHAGRRQ